jgi:hypothetical protein
MYDYISRRPRCEAARRSTTVTGKVAHPSLVAKLDLQKRLALVFLSGIGTDQPARRRPGPAELDRPEGSGRTVREATGGGVR